jgi:site-specific recombinase XerD
MSRSPGISQDTTSLLASFIGELERQEAAVRTLATYRFDLDHFFNWFAQTVGDSATVLAVSRTAVRDCRAHLLTVERREPATVNRRLAALRRFFQ